MLKRFGLLLVVIVLIVLPVVGCSGGSETHSSIEMVPERANLLGQVNLTKILTDEDLTALYDKAPKDPGNPQTFEEALDNLKDDYDIDLMDFNEIIFFTDTSESADAEDTTNFALIVKGTFDKDDLLAAIEDAATEGETELESTDYKGYELHVFEDEDGAFVFLSDEMLVIGTMEWVKDVIDVANGDGKALSGMVLDTYNDLGDTLVKMAVETVEPGQAEEKLPDEMGDLLGDMSALEDIKTVGLTLDKKGSSVAVDMKMCASDTESAEELQEAIDGLIGIIGFAASMSENAEENEALLSLLEEIDVSQSGSCVDVELEMTLSEIEEYLETATPGIDGTNIPWLGGFGE